MFLRASLKKKILGFSLGISIVPFCGYDTRLFSVLGVWIITPCLYFHVYSDPKRLCHLEFYLYNCVQIICIKNSYLKLKLFTIMCTSKRLSLNRNSYLKPYNSVQIICIREKYLKLYNYVQIIHFRNSYLKL